MKSHINFLADHREAPIETEVLIPYPQKELEKKLKAVARAGRKVISPDTAEAGDVAVLGLESELARFNKKSTFVTIGGGLLDPEFEKTLTGRRAGDVYLTAVDGCDVRVTVKQLSRTIFPEPDDDMVRVYAKTHDEYAGINSLAEYKERVLDDCFEEARAEIYYDKYDEVLEYLLTHSDFEFDEAELQTVLDSYKEYVQEALGEQGKTSLDDMSSEELMQAFGAGTPEEVEEVLRSSAERDMAISLISAYMSGADVSGLTPEELSEQFYLMQPLDDFLAETLKIKEER